MNCKKCNIGYGQLGCHGMRGIGSVILLCDSCYNKWEKFYTAWKIKKFPDGIPFYWINWSGSAERDELFKEWIKPTIKVFIFR